MDHPTQNQAVTNKTVAAKVVTPAVSQAANPALAVSKVTSAVKIDAPVAVEDDSITALRSALAAAGVDASNIHMEVHNDSVSYMMGSYQDKQLVVQLPGGRTASYSADLVLRNPAVTVTEMKSEQMV